MAGRTSSARPATPSGRTRGHGTRRHAPPSSERAGTGRAGTPRRLQDSPGPGLACAPTDRSPTGRHPPGHNGTGTPRRHPPGHDGPLPNGPSTQRARHARRSDRRLPSAARPPGVVEPPNGSAFSGGAEPKARLTNNDLAPSAATPCSAASRVFVFIGFVAILVVGRRLLEFQ